MRRNLILACFLASFIAAALLVTGCGDGGGDGGSNDVATELPGDADPDAAGVIEDWSDALRGGDVEAAADFFEVPSYAQNPVPLQLSTREEVVAFNEALPCGAELTDAETEGRYTIATFELTERPGPGKCGEGTGSTAKTAFRIEDGLIVEWRRIPNEPLAEPPTEGPVV